MKFKIGDRVHTNIKYTREMGKWSRSGVLLRQLTWGTGLWRVWLDGFARPQHVHENYLEADQ